MKTLQCYTLGNYYNIIISIFSFLTSGNIVPKGKIEIILSLAVENLIDFLPINSQEDGRKVATKLNVNHLFPFLYS